MLDLKQLRDTDPLKRVVEKETGQAEFSPMDPPEAYAPPAGGAVPEADLHPVLRDLLEDHRALEAELEAFEATLDEIREKGPGAAQQGVQRFFRFLDEAVVRHHLKEEKVLFPVLQERLLETGAHGRGAYARTAVDMLEDDHVKVMQLAGLAFNFLGLSVRLPDAASRALVLDAALEQGKALVELLRLHLFREENVVFPMAHERLTPAAFEAMTDRMARYASY